MSNPIYGLQTNYINNIKVLLSSELIKTLEFIVIPLFHPRNRRNCLNLNQQSNESLLTRSDSQLTSKQWISNIVGCISIYIDCDSSDEVIRQSSINILNQEIQWASHLGLQAVLIPTPRSSSYVNYARNLLQICLQNSYQQLWLRVPIDGWLLWDKLSALVDYHHRLSIALDINDIDSLLDTIDSQSDSKIADIMNRWNGLPIKAVIISTKIFIPNKNGYPILSKTHQLILKSLLKHKIHVIYIGRSSYNNYNLYSQYITYLHSQLVNKLNDKWIDIYKDTLQSPLQPLMDNLQSQTYEVFEQDTIKYSKYQEAIHLAIVDLQSKGIDRLIVMVVGAGRGPLIQSTIDASKDLNIQLSIYAIEKNNNAIITLRNRVIQDSWTNVSIIHQDMRYYHTNLRADIIVSELLGSFGDNELSPECLDGVQSHLNSSHGIMIPSSYTSYLAPLSALRLWKGARDMPNGNGLDSPYVVKLHSCDIINDSKPLFRFVHPNRSDVIDNTRYKSLEFISPYTTTIHGFSGTFESYLYKDVLLSIQPSTHTEDMYSWFPIYLPLSRPVRVSANDVITIHMWRCKDDRKVWYEWCLTSPCITSIQNSGGKSYWIGL